MGNESSKSKERYLEGPCMEVVFVMVSIAFIIELIGSSGYNTYGCIHEDKKTDPNYQWNYEDGEKLCQSFLGVYIAGIFITLGFVLYMLRFVLYKPLNTKQRTNGPNTAYEYCMFIFIVVLMGIYCSSMLGYDPNMENGTEIDTENGSVYYQNSSNSEQYKSKITLLSTQTVNFTIMFICLILVAVYVGYINEKQ